jgi:hypothetical protein
MRPGDDVVLELFAKGKNLVIDAVFTIVYCNTVFQKVAYVLGHATKHAEDRNFLAGKSSAEPIAAIHGGPHIRVPFAIEDGRRIGADALALLPALEKGIRPPFA